MRTKGNPTHGDTTKNETTDGWGENGNENDVAKRRLKPTGNIWNGKEYRKLEGAGKPADMFYLC